MCESKSKCGECKRSLHSRPHNAAISDYQQLGPPLLHVPWSLVTEVSRRETQRLVGGIRRSLAERGGLGNTAGKEE